MALPMLVVFWAVMSVAGLATEGPYRALGIVPAHRSAVVAPAHGEWNHTTFLHVMFLGVVAVPRLHPSANRSGAAVRGGDAAGTARVGTHRGP
jgi:hypothetical protein